MIKKLCSIFFIALAITFTLEGKAVYALCGHGTAAVAQVETAMRNYPSTDFDRSAFESFMLREVLDACNGQGMVNTSLVVSNIDDNLKETSITYTFRSYCNVVDEWQECTRTFSVVLPEPVPSDPTVVISQSGDNVVVSVGTNINNYKSIKIYNGSTLVYDGANKIYSEPIDISAGTPSLTEGSTLSSSCKFCVKAPSTNKRLTYSAEVISHYGNYISSRVTRTFDASSVAKGYAIKVDKSPNTDPGTTINSTDGSFSTSGYKRGDVVYVHARMINTFNKVSDVLHYKYVVQQTAQDLNSDISSLVNNLSIDNSTDLNNINSSIIRLRTNANIPYTLNTSSRVNGTKYTKGKWSGIINIDGTSSVVSRPIATKPEYQTEEELKQDITDYLGKTSYNIEKKVPDTVPYSYSKDTTKLEQDIINRCKTNQSLSDIELKLIKNTATEKSKGQLEYEIALK